MAGHKELLIACIPYWKYGGAEKQFRYMAEVLESNYRLQYIVADQGSDHSGCINIGVRVEFKGVRFSKIGSIILFYIKSISAILKSKPKILYGYSLYCFPILFVVSFISKIYSLKIDCIYSERILNAKVNSTRWIKFMYWIVPAILVNSKSMEEFFKNNIKHKNVVVLYNKVEPISHSKSVNIGEEVKIGVPARICKEKNQEFLLKILKKSDYKITGKKLRVNLYGEVDNMNYFRLITDYVRESLGRVVVNPNADIGTIYSENDLIVLPSISEGMSNVVIEGMISEKPILCSRIRENVDTGIDQRCLFDFSLESFCMAFDSCLSTETLSEIVSNNKSIAKKMYFSGYKEKVLKIFSNYGG